jgi:apolipoprotein N-acyltransferase
MNGGELFLGGMAAFALLAVTIKAQTGMRRARAAADIARVGTSAVSLIGRVFTTALMIVGVQWLVITHPSNPTLLWVVLGLPALLASYTLTKALTVFEIRPSSHGRSNRR